MGNDGPLVLDETQLNDKIYVVCLLHIYIYKQIHNNTKFTKNIEKKKEKKTERSGEPEDICG